ncbi:MAG: M20 family metallopeptidase [Chloroflexia bacterium]
MTIDTASKPMPPDVVDTLWRQAEILRPSMVEFARRLVRTPSLPGQEGDVARLVQAEMQSLGYDQASIDDAGNVIGKLEANDGGAATGSTAQSSAAGRSRRSIMFNTHMDHVDVGDESRWPHPPYEAALVDGEIWGRGTADLKGPLACQVYAGALLREAGLPCPNDVYVVGVLQEEVSGLGSYHLVSHLKTDYAVLGEPSANMLALGHRGRVEVQVTITGKSVHASVPGSGANPLYSMARLLSALEQLRFEPDPNFPDLGATTVAPTLISTDQTSANVVPGECGLILDFRNSPIDTPEVIVQRVRELLQASLQGGATGTADILPKTLVSYKGLSVTLGNAAPAFGIAPDRPLVTGAKAALNAALKRQVPTKIWPFCTDAGHLVAAGIEVIGFGPGHEEVIHTVNERISVDMMVEAMVANAALALALA